MSQLIIDDKFIIEYIEDILNDAKIKLIDFQNDLYHHNTNYDSVPNIIKYGIIPINKLIELGLLKKTTEELKILNDVTSHINGTNGISLSKTGLSDLYNNEIEYNPYSIELVDILISNSIKAARFTEHYGNEFITFNTIKAKYLKSIDIRLINYINKKEVSDELFYNSMINKYNNLILISKKVKKYNLDICIREMSREKKNLDIDLLSKLPKLIRKDEHNQNKEKGIQKIKKK